ncbi:MexX/AxyX family multidrug efflux RND transporter periplasmic adaptor subunit [Oryzomicrobium sp.]|uniref:MexX/AxyX family multidrug efflux RND transporter periplasmic adaptor subunit n=1 Tax=Oryzomicrobium sp. TaxID=1911578 RepID=UPI002FE176BD
MTTRSCSCRPSPAALALAAALPLLAACGKEPPAAPPPAPEAVVIVATPRPESLTTQLPGRLEAFRSAEVRARVAGIVIERRYQEGQDVREGEVLFRIDPKPLQATLDAARGALARAEAEHAAASDQLARYKDLVAERAISERDHIEAVAAESRSRADVASARAELRRAELNLGYASVTAPIAGRARRALVTEGALVGQDAPTPLTRIEQIDPIYVNFSRPASEVFALQRDIQAGRIAGPDKSGALPVRLVLPDGRPYGHEGKLLFADLAVDPGTDSIAMRALFPNPERQLLPGAYVEVHLSSAVDPGVVRIPREALLRGATGASVRTVDTQGKVADVPVRAERMDGRDWLVTEGLRGGERVIVQNVAQFAPGSQAAARPLGAKDTPSPAASTAEAR